MTFLLADTFTDSLTRLTGDEQKACTRAQDRLFVSDVVLVSEFLEDLEPSAGFTEAGDQP